MVFADWNKDLVLDPLILLYSMAATLIITEKIRPEFCIYCSFPCNYQSEVGGFEAISSDSQIVCALQLSNHWCWFSHKKADNRSVVRLDSVFGNWCRQTLVGCCGCSYVMELLISRKYHRLYLLKFISWFYTSVSLYSIYNTGMALW